MGAVRTPQFLAIHHVVPVGIKNRLGSDIGGIRSGERFSERESGDSFAGDDRQVLAFLLFGAEQEHRHRDTDRLRHGDREGKNVAPSRHEHEGTPVVRVRESKTAILSGDLHAERAEREQPFQ